MKRPHSHIQKRKGFSFGETLLAVFVLSIGLLSVVKLFEVSITQSLVIRDAMVASGLSQEGVELVRNVRDNHFATGGNGFGSFSTTNRHCYIAVDNTNLNCYASQSGTLRYNLTYSGGQYVSTTSASKYRRYIHIQYTSGSNAQAIVRSFVVWEEAPLPPSTGSTANCTIRNKCVYTETILKNWKT